MLESLLIKLKVFKYVVYAFLPVMSVLECVALYWTKSAEQSNNIGLGILMLISILSLLVFVALFDKSAQPFLYVYDKAINIVPYMLVCGMVLSFLLLWQNIKPIYCSIVAVGLNIVAIIIFFIFTRKASAVTEEQIRNRILQSLIKIDEQHLEYLKGKNRFFKWNSFAVIVLIVVVGKYIASIPVALIGLVFAVYVYCIVSYVRLYKIKYPNMVRRMVQMFVDSIVYFAFAVFAVLLAFGVIDIYIIDGAPNSAEIAELIAFGTVPFVKINAFAYFAKVHHELEINLETERS